MWDYYLVVDLEATCCDRKTIKSWEMETIEIGAVMVKAENLAIIDEFQTFIKPIRHPQLTSFCLSLTSISQSQVDQAPGYPEAIENLKQWITLYPNYVFCSWGNFDHKQIQQDCKFHNISYPFTSTHLNLKQLFTQNQNFPKRYGMAQALELTGLTLEGTHHRGIDDARNIAKLLPYILGQKLIK